MSMDLFMQRIRHAIRRDTEAMVGSLAMPRDAIVSNVDPARHMVRVTLQPEGVLSGWIPDASAMSGGGGFGVIAPCAIGDQVHVSFAHGDADNGRIIGRIFSTMDMPPTSPKDTGTGKPVQPREWAVFCPGAFIHMSGGTVYVQASELRLKGNLVVDGDISSTTGDVSDKHGSLDRLRANYDAHDHASPVGTTNRPDQE